jgi:hypothetical protein
LRAEHEAKTEESRQNAFNAATQANQAAKDEAAKIIKNARSVQNKAYAELPLSNLSDFARDQQPEVICGSDTDNPRAHLEKSCDIVRSESGLLIEGIRHLDRHRANIARRRPIATCMVIIAIPTIVLLTTLSFLTFQQPVPGLVSTMVAIVTEQIGIVAGTVATSVAATQQATQPQITASDVGLDEINAGEQLINGDSVVVNGVKLTATTRANNACGGFAFELVIENVRSTPVSMYFEVAGIQGIYGGTPPQDGCYSSTIHQQNISVPAQQSLVYGFRDLGSTGPTTLSVTVDEQTATWKLR